MKMKNFKMKALAVMTLALVASPSMASDTVRLMVLDKNPMQKVSSKKAQISTFSQASLPNVGESCLTTPDGNNEWCITKKAKKVGVSYNTASQQSSVSFNQMEVVELPSYGYDANSVAEMLNEDGRFGYVEVDYEVTTGDFQKIVANQESVDSPRSNDPNYSSLNDYFTSVEESPVGMDIFNAWDKYPLFDKKDSIDVLVFDSSFFLNDDLDYHVAGGRSFSLVPLTENGPFQDRGNTFDPPQEALDLGICTGHGLSVAGIIAATNNNGIGASGVLNNVVLHPIRVMTCGKGYLSDSIEALEWAAGKPIENVNPYEGKPGVINISLRAISDRCGDTLQAAINKATDAGFTVVVAVGNDNANDRLAVPASCENVISVASLDKSGSKSSFSNYDENVKVSVLGEFLATPCDETNDSCLISGTSTASPLVAGVIAATRLKANPSREVLDLALKFSSNSSVIKDDCVIGGVSMCGSGVPNLMKMIDISERAANGTLNTIEFVLDKDGACDDTWLLNNFSDALPICEIQKVTFFAGNIAFNTTFKLFESAKGTTEEATLIGEYTKSEAYVSALNVAENDYTVQYCESGVCNDTFFEVNTDLATEEFKPESCK